MKKVILLAGTVLLLQITAVQAQVAAENAQSGEIVLPDNSAVTGVIKENIRKKGEIVLEQGDKKTKYKAGDITSVTIGSTTYISANYSFYEVLWQGRELELLRRASNPPSVVYNGTEPVAVPSSEGKIDDLFIREKGANRISWLNKKNGKEVLAGVGVSWDSESLDAESLKKALVGK